MKDSVATILIVDDAIQNRKLLEALLRPEGYVTLCAASGEEALESIAHEAPDLVLLDVMMPGMDGCDVAKALKADPATSSIPIIMVTSHIDPRARLAGLSAGAEEFLTKPVDRSELWLRVRNLLKLKALGDLLHDHGLMLEQEVRDHSAELQRFRAAMDATGDAIMQVNRTTLRFVEVNVAACDLLGYSRDELLLLGPLDLTAVSREDCCRVYDAVIAGESLGALTEVEMRCKDGSILPVEVRHHAQSSGEEWIVVTVLTDIRGRREVEKRLHRLAHYDVLTGLPNRTLFFEAIKKTLVLASERGWTVAVLFVDLDHFKNVNDTLGHAAGDELLREFSNRLLACVRLRDTVGRLGGDEFALVLVMEDGQKGAAQVADKIRAVLRIPFVLKGHQVSVTASIGITISPDDASDPETLIKYADTAMYRAKQAGRDTSCFFTTQMNIDVLARLDLETSLRRAIVNDEFVLHYQPKVRLDTGRVSGAEALLRWQRPGVGLVAPGEFIPVLEETGMIVDVGRWVIATACAQIRQWRESGVGPIQVAVNVSGRQFVDGDLVGDVSRAIASNGIDAGLLELELTESTLMANTDRTVLALQQLKDQGVEISIDDFGTGYSSLAYLQKFPIDKLKIDIAFIRDITTNPDDATIALTIIRMAHSLELEVVAEGVETEGQLAYLRSQRCDQIQGYYFSRPLPASEFEQLVRDGRCLLADDRGGPVAPMTLMLVDADPVALAGLQALFRPDGYRIFTASSAGEALEVLAEHEVQVMVCDQALPGTSGTGLLERVKALHPRTLRIVLAGYTDPGAIVELINRGAIHQFHTVPWDTSALTEGIRDAFRHYCLLYDLPADPPLRRLPAAAAL
jgi:diguanylate cyclase (GGDEF)-like protein/PAS domain S-box-containing protein